MFLNLKWHLRYGKLVCFSAKKIYFILNLIVIFSNKFKSVLIKCGTVCKVLQYQHKNTTLKIFARDKCSSLFRNLINDDKKVYKINLYTPIKKIWTMLSYDLAHRHLGEVDCLRHISSQNSSSAK
jgi:hypothetical protein